VWLGILCHVSCQGTSLAGRRKGHMKFGVCLTHYGREIRSSELVEAVAEIERLGFDSIRVTDHVVIPQGVREAQLIYRERMLEAFTVFSYLAAVSRHAQLGSSIVVFAYRNPIVMAKMLARESPH